ncbi:MAG: hypothetical protein ACK5AZ_12575 [Bryobacteraceae bacterium]
MGTRFLSVFLLALPVFGAYQYYYSDALTSVDPAKWTTNGSVTTSASGLTATSSSGGSLISTVPVPDGTGDYEVRSIINHTSQGGVFIHYLRASADARSGPGATGTYYAVEYTNSNFNGSACSGNIRLYKRVGGVVTEVAMAGILCRNGMEMRSIYTHGGQIAVYIDGEMRFWAMDTSISGGQPGVGGRSMPAGSSISELKLGPLDRVNPGTVNPQSVGHTTFSNKVELQWQGTPDDPNGTGVWAYQVLRNGVWAANLAGPRFFDLAVQPGTTYTYHSCPN